MAPKACQVYEPAVSSRMADIAPLLERIDRLAQDQNRLSSEPATTSIAVNKTKSLLQEVAIYSAIPKATVLPLNGGIQVIWAKDSKNLKLYCSDNQTYIYRNRMAGKKVAESAVVEDIHGSTLATQLSWLLSS